MLQQTPVPRVAPAWSAWLERWPEPADLAADAPGEAVRAWGRLGYPRRALRLHAAACACVESYEGRVPDTYAGLRALPGVGDYTAAAVLAFAYGQRAVVLDTNVRRVHARLLGAHAFEPAGAPTRAERDRAGGDAERGRSAAEQAEGGLALADAGGALDEDPDALEVHRGALHAQGGGGEKGVTELAVALCGVGLAQPEPEQGVGAQSQQVAVKAELLGQAELQCRIGREQVRSFDTGPRQAGVGFVAHGLHGPERRRQGPDVVGDAEVGSHSSIIVQPVRNS
jgi:hypothetical protein